MLEKEHFIKIKQSNISTDYEKTKQRVKEAWKPLTKNLREKIVDLGDISQSTVERTYTIGNISVKLAASMAQVLKINPFYLSGESDDKEEFSEELLNKFIEQHGYGDLLAPAPKKRRYKSRVNQADGIEDNSDAAELPAVAEDYSTAEHPVFCNDIELPFTNDSKDSVDAIVSNSVNETIPLNNAELPVIILSKVMNQVHVLSDEEKNALDQMTEDEAISLLKGILLRAKYNKDAEYITYFLKLLLTV